jgi:prepilin-type N-terminal cleavage/methylation domain-containing protein
MDRHVRLNDQKGFTLIEIAIVLVIIGLLIGGVLKGQSMIYNAKEKRLVNDINGMRAAVLTFQDRYAQLPGDCSRSLGAADVVGNGDGVIANNATEAPYQDLRFAQLISGATTLLTPPTNNYGGTISLYYATYNTLAGNWFIASMIPAEVCQDIDTKYDDGLYNSGDIQGSAVYTAGTNITLRWKL